RNGFNNFRFPFGSEVAKRKDFIAKPSIHPFLKNGINLKFISCGFSHSILLTRENNIIEFGQMDKAIAIDTIKESKWNHNEIIDVKAGFDCYVILTIDGSVFGYGNNANGQIGFEENNEFVSTPTKIKELNDITKIET